MRITARDLPLLTWILIRTYGWRGIGRRAAYELSHRSGRLARVLPAEDRLIPAEPDWTWPLRFDIDEIRHRYGQLTDLEAIRDQVLAESERVLAGEMRFYGWAWKRVGWPPKWHVNPWTSYEYPRQHWARISDFAPKNGDIKDVWEMSRLPFTYLFARAWVLTGDDRFPEEWWRAIEDWAEHNPPNRGVNWKCGQETSLRGIALQFGLMTFADHPSTTPKRLRLVGGLLQASVRRVLPTLRYSLSQRNNHAISEAVFLETMAIVATRRSSVSGHRALREAIADQFYDDGWYAQQSFNYQRLALHTLIWLGRVRTATHLGPEAAATSAVSRSAALLRAAQDPKSGWLPNLGPNDSALLFPLTTCSQRDFRPILAVIDKDNHGTSPWDEEDIWLCPGTHTQAVKSMSGVHVLTMRGSRTHLVVRTGATRHRAHHNDLLHIDLWIDGENFLADPGTYRYTAPPPWANALAARRVHNVPYTEAMMDRRFSRFLALSWPISKVLRHDVYDRRIEVVELYTNNNGYTLSRIVVRNSDTYVVIDDAHGVAFSTRWTVGSAAETSLTPAAAEIVAGSGYMTLYGDAEPIAACESEPSSAWIAPSYGLRRPTTAFIVRSDGSPLIAAVGPYGVELPSIDFHAIRSREGDPRNWVH